MLMLKHANNGKLKYNVKAVEVACIVYMRVTQSNKVTQETQD